MKRQKQNVKKTIQKKIELKGGSKSRKTHTIIDKQPKPKKNNVVLNPTPTVRKEIVPVAPVKKERKITKPVHVELVSTPTIRKRVDERHALRVHGKKKEEVIKYKPIQVIKKPVSIIVTAYQSQRFIEECLDSIEKQTYFVDNDDFEVLVGVDGCKTTLDKLLEIRHKYRNLRIFEMRKNVGTFVTTNTLINKMSTENFIRFDSDDIMLPQMVNEIMYYSEDYDIVKFSYYNFNEEGIYRGQDRLKVTGNKYAAGVIYFNKNVFDIYGGYQPWVCTAEGEILIRIGTDLRTKAINIGLFRRRIHKSSLTQNEETGMKSKLRERYHELIEKNRLKGVKKIKRIGGEYAEK